MTVYVNGVARFIDSATIQIAAGATSQAWVHNRNSDKVWVIPIEEVSGEWYYVIDNVNQITVHMPNAQIGRTVNFTGFVST